MKLFKWRLSFIRVVNYDDHRAWIELGKWGRISITSELAADLGLHSKPKWPVETWPRGFTKVIKQGGLIPKWYGFARYDHDMAVGIYMPIPINLIVVAYHAVMNRIKYDWPVMLHSWGKLDKPRK